jgi:hypothetical protein
MAKVALIVAVLFAAIAGAAWMWLDYAVGGLCGNTVVEEAVSPSGMKRAILFERSCGATTGFSSQLSILAAKANFPNDGGNAFVAEGYPEGYELRWLDDSTLQVIGVKGRVFKRESQVSGISVRYEE